MAHILRCRTPMETPIKGLVIPVLVNLVVTQIYPETLVTRDLPQQDLEDLEILGEINEALTHEYRTILHCIFIYFHSCIPNPTKPGLPSFADSISSEFQNFAFHGLEDSQRDQILENAAGSFSCMKTGKISAKEVGHHWEAILEKVNRRVRERYDIGLFSCFSILRKGKKPDTHNFDNGMTERLERVFDFCFAYVRAGILDRHLPLFKFWYGKMGGNYDTCIRGSTAVTCAWNDVFRSATIIFIGFRVLPPINAHQVFYTSLGKLQMHDGIASDERDCMELYRSETKKMLEVGLVDILEDIKLDVPNTKPHLGLFSAVIPSSATTDPICYLWVPGDSVLAKDVSGGGSYGPHRGLAQKETVDPPEQLNISQNLLLCGLVLLRRCRSRDTLAMHNLANRDPALWNSIYQSLRSSDAWDEVTSSFRAQDFPNLTKRDIMEEVCCVMERISDPNTPVSGHLSWQQRLQLICLVFDMKAGSEPFDKWPEWGVNDLDELALTLSGSPLFEGNVNIKGNTVATWLETLKSLVAVRTLAFMTMIVDRENWGKMKDGELDSRSGKV
ncbi:hypothetical protein FGG08_003129 [Glutinoglossum americanum]|uniref:Uncharacterized protein n=1 Tax=Glutinoglossum americanum TaxID=1670608 RepID=A0A9P8IDU8_9PEZI|nr:hypothetical protein FGG08_003129 [Glutinoglossum americanum]